MGLHWIEGQLKLGPTGANGLAVGRTTIVFRGPVQRLVATLTGFETVIGGGSPAERLFVQLGVSQASVPSSEVEIVGHMKVGGDKNRNGEESAGTLSFVAFGME